jgi:hypothetical protein
MEWKTSDSRYVAFCLLSGAAWLLAAGVLRSGIVLWDGGF